MNSSPISRWPDDPGSHIAFPDRPPRMFPDRGSRRRNAVNRLLCALAVAGIGGACWGFWLEYDEHRDVAASREKIVSACGGLVAPDAVLRLNGGIYRVKPSSDADDTIDSEQQTGSCVIYRVGEPGTTYAHFALTVVPQPSDGYANIVSGSSKNPFDRRDRPRDEALVARADEALPHPLGDGRLGHYDDSTATAKAVCANPARTKGRITSVKALAVAQYEEDADVTAADLRALAGIARHAADRAADRLGCEAALPEVPKRLAAAEVRLGRAESASGTCGWYARFTAKGRGELPDRALDAPAGSASWQEACLLAVSADETRRIWPHHADGVLKDQRLSDALRFAGWWVRTQSFFGDEAAEVVAEGFGGDQVKVAPGTAGRGRGTRVWWASSVCEGRPAVHTMTLGNVYDRVVQGRLSGLLRAYVDDVAARRGCTDVKFPEPADFVRE
ncbi:hypothetical protein OG735_20385 [Streptomyces sp. NBC_01210]|uniref:hypothetical protein n=1 Tax=Streptomyces sp. NBC_01210 TaxID=2903774 RepID=UPI002E141633|nr:hypothetical protein OG735_20385 [Streptomyces sp. NBC_01210]